MKKYKIMIAKLKSNDFEKYFPLVLTLEFLILALSSNIGFFILIGITLMYWSYIYTKNKKRRYGEYSFEDKAPEEVMNIPGFDRIFRNKSIKDVADILNKFYDIAENKEHAISVIESCINRMDDRDDFEELWNYDKYDIFEY